MFDEPVIEISTREVVTITSDATITKAIGIMEKNNFHNLIVLTSDDIYLVNIHDLLMASNPESYVGEFMFKPNCIQQDTPIVDAIVKMIDSGQQAAPVLAGNGDLVGIVTEYDIMRRGSESRFLRDTNVRKIMSREPVCVKKHDSIGKARALMRKNNIGRVLVVDEMDGLVGIVTGGDILRKIYKPKRKMTSGEVKGERVTRMAQPVSQIMSSPMITADMDANLADVANLIQTHDIRGVPVVREGKPKGIVTIPDIMNYLSTLKERAMMNVEIQGAFNDEYKELADRIIETEVQKIVKLAGRVHWIKIVVKKERDRGGISYYKIGVRVKTPGKLYVSYAEPGGIKTMITGRGGEDVEVKAGKRRWDFAAVLKDALVSVEGQIEEDRSRRKKQKS